MEFLNTTLPCNAAATVAVHAFGSARATVRQQAVPISMENCFANLIVILLNPVEYGVLGHNFSILYDLNCSISYGAYKKLMFPQIIPRFLS